MILKAPLKWVFVEKLSFLYDQTIAMIKTAIKAMAKAIFPGVNIFYFLLGSNVYFYNRK